MPRVIKLLEKVIYPLRRLGKVLFELIILDVAMVIYGYAKRQFKNEKPEEEDIVNDYLWPDWKGRRW